MARRSYGPNTQAIHSGIIQDREFGEPLSPPIVHTSSFGFESVEAMEHSISHPGTGYIYTRIHNPTTDAMEQAIAEMEHGEKAVSFASGMGAIHAALLANLKAGDHIVAPISLYGGAYALMTRLLPNFGITTTFVDDIQPDNFRAAIRPETRVLYAETISNPLVRVPDLSAIAQLAHEHQALCIVDSTLATPCLAQPLDAGVDLVVHSASKYLGGHGDLIGGVVVGNNSLMGLVHHLAINAGGIMAPFVAWLVLRGLKTLPLRMHQHQVSAKAIAHYLDGHPKVQRCMYPGLSHHPDHAHAQQSLSNEFGGIVSFEVLGGEKPATQVANHLQLFTCAGSLGDTHSLVVQPAMSSHRTLSPEARVRAGIHPGFLRLSIGLENAEDLIADLGEALSIV
ncbi:MAG: aminotransferase class I/II-fold pyridoxal phosphate-dependent enzyme [Myxococcales bacterium]|nr:aminotransferase class I/II-fold pyridoxal phosphate-dependent enzyme [Myxococcales bacterium]